jgi:outer membrane protein OmpA-like peptidoglycan-associated protein
VNTSDPLLGTGQLIAYLFSVHHDNAPPPNRQIKEVQLTNKTGSKIKPQSFIFFKLKLAANIMMATAAIVACSSEPKVNELKKTTDPQVEFDRVDGNIRQAQSQQVDILSPKNFEAATRARTKASEARAANKNQEVVLHDLAVAQTYLDKANGVANIAIQILKGPSEARQDAMTAKAGTYFPKETLVADKTFKKLTEQIEDNDISIAESKRGSLEASYRDLELRSIKKEKLGPAISNIEDAIKEGAKKLTPETLAWAQTKYAADEAIIEKNRHKTAEINQASADATASASRLLKMVRYAKGSTAKNPEELAKQRELGELTAVQSENDLHKVETDLARTQGKLANTAAQNAELQSQVWLDKEYDAASSQFTKDEADVYKQGGKLLLRLKGLTFANNSSTITAANFPLLAKVQKIIGDVGTSTIAIEGHTDSKGGKKVNDNISTMRAESVQAYLVANKNIAMDNISAKGFGDSKPIATNKTVEGRAQNRRVDVIITAEPAKQ